MPEKKDSGLVLRPEICYWFIQKEHLERAIENLGLKDVLEVKGVNFNDPVHQLSFQKRLAQENFSCIIYGTLKIDTEKHLPSEYETVIGNLYRQFLEEIETEVSRLEKEIGR